MDGDSVPREQEVPIINNTQDGHDIREALIEYFCNNPLYISSYPVTNHYNVMFVVLLY